jgi:hypothetical protein
MDDKATESDQYTTFGMTQREGCLNFLNDIINVDKMSVYWYKPETNATVL